MSVLMIQIHCRWLQRLQVKEFVAQVSRTGLRAQLLRQVRNVPLLVQRKHLSRPLARLL
jgi:hypothetical protein